MDLIFVIIRLFFQVLLLTGAVASHKFVVGFCLGLELAGVGKSVLKLVFAVFIFSIGSVIGIGIGMLTFQVRKFFFVKFSFKSTFLKYLLHNI